MTPPFPRSKLLNWTYRLLHNIPHDNFGFIYVPSSSSANAKIMLNSNPAWEEHYINNDYIKWDTRYKQARKSFLPFTWQATTREPLPPRQKEIYEASLDYQCSAGVIIPIHFNGSPFSALGLNFKKYSPSFETRILSLYNLAPIISLYLSSYAHALFTRDEGAIYSLEKRMEHWLKANHDYEDVSYKRTSQHLADLLSHSCKKSRLQSINTNLPKVIPLKREGS